MSGLEQWLAAGGDDPLPEGCGASELRQALENHGFAFQALCGDPEVLATLTAVGDAEVKAGREYLRDMAHFYVDREKGLSAYQVALGRLAEDLIARDPASAVREYQWVHQLLHGMAGRILLGAGLQEWDPPSALDWLSLVLQRSKTGQHPLLSIEQPNRALMQTIGAAGEVLCAPEGMSSMGKVTLAGLVIRAVNPEGGHPYISQLKKLGLNAEQMDALWSARRQPSELRNALSQHKAFDRATFEVPLFRRICDAIGLDTDLSRVDLEASLSEAVASATDAAVLLSCTEIRSQGARSEALVKHIAHELGVEESEVPWSEGRVWQPNLHRGFWIAAGGADESAQALLDGLQAELGEQAGSIGGLVVLRIAKAELRGGGRSAARQAAAQLGQQDELVDTILTRWKAGDRVAELPSEVSRKQLPVLSCEPGCEELSLELFGPKAGERMLEMAGSWPARAWEPLAIVAANRVASGVHSESTLQGEAGIEVPRGREMQDLWSNEWGSSETRGVDLALVHISMHMSPSALGDVGNDLKDWLLAEWKRLMEVRMREAISSQGGAGARAILEAWRREADGPKLDAGPQAFVRGDQSAISTEVKRQLRLQKSIRIAQSGRSVESYSAARQRRRSFSIGHLIVGLVAVGLVLVLFPIVAGAAARLDVDSVEASAPGGDRSAWPAFDASGERLAGPLASAVLEPAGAASTGKVRMAELVTWDQLSSLYPWPDAPSGPGAAEVGLRVAIHFIDLVNEIGPSRVFQDLPGVEGSGAWLARLPLAAELGDPGSRAEWLSLERPLPAPVAQDVHTTEGQNVSELQKSTGFRMVLEWSPGG
jgi:hypothetical protein